jgi:RNA polymerase sigma-70 factor, ECF subfamily
VERQDERKLLKRIRRGEREACEEFVRGHYRAVYGFQAHLCRDVHLAEDLTQETFAAAWSGLGSFAGRSSFKTWLCRVAYHKFIDAKRRGLVHAEKAREFQQFYASQIQDHTVGEGLMAAERNRLLHDAVSELEEDDRLIITLHYLQDLSYREMASVLGKPTGTLKWLTSQALQRLRARLNGRMEI